MNGMGINKNFLIGFMGHSTGSKCMSDISNQEHIDEELIDPVSLLNGH